VLLVAALVSALIAWQRTRQGGLVISPAHAAPASPTTPPHDPWPGFADAGGTVLHLPVPRPVAVLYHEASLPGGLTLRPWGHCARNENRTKYRVPAAAPPGRAYTVMSSRGRPHPATSAVDVVVGEGQQVYVPVSGTVVERKAYRLYGTYPDLRVAIRSDDGPAVQVVMIHLANVQVHVGDTVVASMTPLGIARVFPFRSQVDDYVAGGHPHVHMEVKRAPQAVQ